MEKTKKKIWYRTNGFWGTIAAFLAVIVAVFAIIVAISSDFSISIDKLEGEIVTGQSLCALLTIDGQKYDKQVKLSIQDNVDGINIKFSPSVGVPSPSFNSTVCFEVENNTTEGDYIFNILATGAKNKREHATTFSLKVSRPDFDPILLDNLFFPDGWMGDIEDMTLDANYHDDSAIDSSCIKFYYSGKGSRKYNWAGIYWQYPNNNWGDFSEGRDLNGATFITFYAKGKRGGERAEFKVGGISGKYRDSCFPPVVQTITLSQNWERYEINISNKDLRNVFGGFCWVTNNSQNPNGCTIYIDQIMYE